jgi:hypothetical protein
VRGEESAGAGVVAAFEWAHASRDNVEPEVPRSAAWSRAHKVGDRRALAANSGVTFHEESEEAPTSSCWLTEGKDNRGVQMTKIVLLYRTDLPCSVKTHPWGFRI